MAVHQHHGAERIYKSSKLTATSSMNITPMIDVLLVLLVIFMAALPLSQRGIDITLPAETQDPPSPKIDNRQIVLSYSANKQISINSSPVTLAELEGELRNIFADRRDKTMFIMAAGTLRYGEIITVLDAAKGAGVDRVGIVTDGMRRAAGVASSGL